MGLVYHPVSEKAIWHKWILQGVEKEISQKKKMDKCVKDWYNPVFDSFERMKPLQRH